MRAIWPSAVHLDQVAQLRLAGAYWRRKRLEGRLLASQIAMFLAGGGTSSQERISTADANAMFFGG